MRIAAMLPWYPPSRRAGAYLATHELLAALARAGHDVHVQARAVTDGYDLDGVHVAPFDGDLDGDVTIGHAGDEHPAARKTTVRMVHAWGDMPDDALAAAELVVFNSYATAQAVGYSGAQVVVRPPLRDVRCTPGDRTTLVNLSWPKGGELFWRLAACAPQRKFLGVRGGWGNQLVRRSNNVDVIGPVDDIAEALSRTRVLLMPSERETWGCVGVEALSCGIPVIAHPTPGLCESLGDAGIFIDRDDAQCWLDELERLDDEDEWDDASQRARAYVPPDDRDRFVEAIEGLATAKEGSDVASRPRQPRRPRGASRNDPHV